MKILATTAFCLHGDIMGIELTLPFLGSVFLYWLLRRLDRSNINFKKLRSILERGEKQLNDIALKKSEQLKDSTTEFDILRINIQKFLEGLKGEVDQIQYAMAELENNKVHFAETKKELFETSRSMTSIQTQVDYINEFLETLDSQQKRIKKLEEHIHTVDSEGAQIIKSFQKSVDKASQENIELANVKIEDILQKASHYQEETRKELLSKQEALTEEVLKKYNSLKDSLRQSGQALSSDIEEKFNKSLSLSDDVQDRLETLESKLNDPIPKMVQKLVDKIHISFAEHEKKVSLLKEELLVVEDEFNKNIQSFKEDITIQKKDIYQDFLKESDALRNQVHRLDLDAIAKKDEIVHAVRKEVIKVEENIDRFNELYLKTQDEISSLVDQETEKINHSMEQLQRANTNANEEYREFIGKQREEINEYLKQVLLEYTNAIDEKINSSKEIHNEIFGHTRSLSDEIDVLLKNKKNEWEETFEINLQEKLEIFVTKTQSFLEEFRLKENDLNTLASNWESRLEAVSMNSKENIENTKMELEKQKINIIEDSLKTLTDFFDEAKKSFELKAKDLQEKMGNELKDIFDLKEDLQNKQANLIDHLKEERRKIENELKSRSYEQLELFERGMSTKTDQFEQAIRESVKNTIEELSSSSEAIKREFLDLKEVSLKDLRKFQQKYEGDIINLHNGIERTDEQLNILQKALINLKSESNIIKVTEEKIETIKEIIADLNFKLSQMEEKEKAIDQIYNRVDELSNFKVQLDTEALMLTKKIKKIDSIEEKLTSLFLIKDQIEERSNQMKDIKVLQDQIIQDRGKMEMEKESLENILEELLNQQKLVESAIHTIGNQDRNIGDLTQQISQIDLLLKKLDTKSENLRAHMEDLSTQMLSIEKNEAEIEAVKERFMQVEDLLEDIDKRKDQIEIMRKKYEDLRQSMNSSVKHIEQIETSAEEKVEKLAEFLNALGGDLNNPYFTDLSKVKSDKKNVIIKLSQMGWTNDEIAQKMSIDMSTVQTVLSTRPN